MRKPAAIGLLPALFAVGQVAAKQCHGKSIGPNDQCCGRVGDRVYWCESGKRCSGTTKCVDDDRNGVFKATLIGALVLFLLAVIVVAIWKWHQRRRRLREEAHEEQRLKAAVGCEAVPVMGYGADDADVLVPTQPSGTLAPPNPGSRTPSCPHGPSAYDH